MNNLNNIQKNVSFAVSELSLDQQRELAFCSEEQKESLLLNQANRLKNANAFAFLDIDTLIFIASFSNEKTVELLARSDDKDSICNYKKAQRIADLALLLNNKNCASSIQLAYTSFLKHKAKYKDLKEIKCSLNETLRAIHVSNDSYAKNVLSALFFFDKVSLNSSLKKHDKFVAKFSKYDTIIIK